MSQCPQCQQEIEIGEKQAGALFTCPHCRAVYFVGWDGQPEIMAGETEESPAFETVTPVEPTAELVPTEYPPSTEYAPTEGPMTSFEPIELMVPMGEPEPVFETPQIGVVTENFDEVEKYGNSDSGTVPISYSIHLKGLELAETFELLREAMTDSRFGWDVEELMSKIHNGEIILRGLSPTKASILVNRVKYLSLDVSWSQEFFDGVEGP